MLPNTRSSTSVSSSAPIRPRRASFSDRLVNPEMSTKQRVPSNRCHLLSGESRSHSDSTRGTYGSSGWV